MIFTPRPYQTDAINAGVNFFHNSENYNGIEILPTGSGKSVVIANIAKELKGKTMVFQPSKEILQQNVRKFMSYGYRAGIYSASAGMKFVDTITFATIGSVAKKHHLFKQVDNIIVDECHLVNSSDGMYKDFFASVNAKVLGLTATPYRLTSTFEGSMLQFITSQRPKLFKEVLYSVQNDVLFNAGHLSKLEYFSPDLIDRTQLEMNKKGTDFSDESVRAYYRKINMEAKTIEYANRILKKRANLLVFCQLVKEAQRVAAGIPGAAVLHGETEDGERDRILKDFTAGRIRCVVNVGVLTTGFDYPGLQAVLIARSTMSMALYYQIVGRVMRPHKSKMSGWVVDLGGNIRMFGKIETMRIEVGADGGYYITNNGRRLTDVTMEKV